MKKQFLLILILLISFTSINTLKAQSISKEIIDQFFLIYEQEPQKAVDYIFSTNKWISEESQEGIDNVKDKLENFLGLVGEYYGYDLITKKNVGENYELWSYIIKYDRQPLRFTFVLYRPKDKWQLQNFQFDDNLGDELKDAGKIYNLN